MPLPKPKVIYFDHCTSCGSASSRYPILVCGGERRALVISEPHHRLKGGGWSGGGPFYTYQVFLTQGAVKELPNLMRNNVISSYRAKGSTYDGAPIKPAPPGVAFWPAWNGSGGVKEDTSSHYATGYARARPGNPVADVGQFIVELRDLPAVPFKRALQGGLQFRNIPRLALKELSDFRNLGSEYLNVVFGWKPFVSDLRKMYHLWQTIDGRMAQIVRENGKYIRRKAKVSEDQSSGPSSSATFSTPYVNVNGGPPNWMTGKTKCTHTQTVKTKVWFSGSFRYYIPDVGSSQWDLRARAALFGALPTPELLWNVLPWSWLVDWFSNVGDVVSNASMNAVDNLTTRFSFIMKQTETIDEWQSHVTHGGIDTRPTTDFFKQYWPEVDHAFTTKRTVVHKARCGGGNPFGLDVKLPSLSGYQLSILAALGISRSRVK